MTNPNIEMLRKAVINLDNLVSELIFVGGCTTGLFITDEGAAEIRTTDDVDTIVEATSYAEYVEFSEKLQNIGFRVDTRQDAPLCRWVKEDTILDVMPLDEKILGFTNKWYKPAVLTAEDYEIFLGTKIRVVTPPYFIATKLEAFRGRGKGDYLASHDLEDIMTVIDGRIEIVDEILISPEDVRLNIAFQLETMLKNQRFMDALPGYLSPDNASQGRLGMLIDRLKKISSFT